MTTVATAATVEQAIAAARTHLRTFVGVYAQTWDGTWLDGMCIYEAADGGYVIGARTLPANAGRLMGYATASDYYPAGSNSAIRMIEQDD